MQIINIPQNNRVVMRRIQHCQFIAGILVKNIVFLQKGRFHTNEFIKTEQEKYKVLL